MNFRLYLIMGFGTVHHLLVVVVGARLANSLLCCVPILPRHYSTCTEGSKQ